MAGWSSGWINTDGTTAVENGATLTFTHNLGATDLIFTLYAADDNLGTNTIAIGVGSDLGNDGVSMSGAQIQSVSSTQVTLQLGSSGYNTLNSTGQRVNGSETSYLGQFIKVLALDPLADPAPEAAGTEVVFIAPYSIPVSFGSWIKVEAQPGWANSGTTTLIVEATTFDQDGDGNTSQTLAARASSDSQFSVNIISHGGTSAGRSVMNEQALIPCSSDGSFEYIYSKSSSNGHLRSFQVVGYVHKSPFIAGSGDLCKFFPDDSGYQMFRNGLTMQWTSSPAFTTESSQVINFPTPFSAKPFKVTASTRYPSGDGSSEEWIQVVSWDTASVTVRAQSQNVGAWTQPVYADIIAIGITSAIGCIDSGAAASGTKISELKNVAELKDDDLFVLSRDKESDGSFDTSNNVSLSDLASKIINDIPENGWSSGWVNTDGTTSVADGADLNFEHNLGTTDVIIQVYAAIDESGTNSINVSQHEISQTDVPREDYGCQILPSLNSVQVVLASQGLNIPDIGATYNASSASYSTYNYIKVVALKL